MGGYLVLLAFIGLGVLAPLGVGALIALYEEWSDTPGSPDPYRAGLDAAARISAMAFEAERAMYEAARQAEHEEAGDGGHLPTKLNGSDDPRRRGGGDRQ